MSNIKQIFLDLDGPLLNGKERHYFCYRSILERFGFKPIGIDEYWETKRALVNRRDLLKMSGAEVIYDDFLAAWLLMIESPDVLVLDKVQEGAVDCLRSWKAQGIGLTLVTMRKNRQAVEEQLTRLKLRPLLDAVLVCDHADGGDGKADAVRSMFQGKLIKEHTLWIGDTEADWEAAKSLGYGVVLLSNGLRNEAYLRSLQGAVVKPSIASLKDEVMGKQNVN
jgi:phosphoglycolate phosphatase-like HAD superfamily hydrolase